MVDFLKFKVISQVDQKKKKWWITAGMYLNYFFDDEADDKIYQDHPIHQEFIKNYGHLWDKVVVYDAVEVWVFIKILRSERSFIPYATKKNPLYAGPSLVALK